jgi:hypothetical protein
VPGGGIEPPRAEARRILSPLRLPVPPSRLIEEGREESSVYHGVLILLLHLRWCFFGCSLAVLFSRPFKLRHRWPEGTPESVLDEIKLRLERRGFDVVDEPTNTGRVWSGAHVHLEYQPKLGKSFWNVWATHPPEAGRMIVELKTV